MLVEQVKLKFVQKFLAFFAWNSPRPQFMIMRGMVISIILKLFIPALKYPKNHNHERCTRFYRR